MNKKTAPKTSNTEIIIGEEITGEGMEYNTQRMDIAMTQYGRNIHKLVDFALTIQDKKRRNRAAEQIIIAMEILNPKIKGIDEYKKVLWTHLAMISNYKLDIDYPCEIIPEEEIKSKPQKIDLIKEPIKKRQYGRVIHKMIQQAIEMTDEELKKQFIQVILLQMKRTYIEWNKDVVKDEVIFEDFLKISNNQLEIPQGHKLPHSYEIRNKQKQNTPLRKENKKSKKKNNRKKTKKRK